MRNACVVARSGRLVALLVAVGCMCVGRPAAGVVRGTPAPEMDHRFGAVGLLFTDQPWAACGGWISGSCVLIDSGTVLVARHSVEDAQRRLPANGSRLHKVRFRRDGDGAANNHFGSGAQWDCAAGYQEIYIQQYIANPAAGVDMVLGVLESEPVGIAPMAIQPSHLVTSGEPVILAGWGFDGTCLGQGEAWTLRTSTGVLPPLRYNSSCCFDFANITYTGNSCLAIPANSNWVVANLHDSGAPLLSPDPDNPTRLRVFGIVTSAYSAQKLSVWNAGGGQPRLDDTPAGRQCVWDFDGDGGITLADLLIFVDRYLVGDPTSDVDGDPGVTPNDLFVYVIGYCRGC